METPVSPSTITIDDFAKLEIRVGLVTGATAVPDSKKLIQLTVDFGTEIGVRTILTGMLVFFPDPSVIAGKKYLFLTNLAPRVMAGIESQGMFMAADGSDGPILIPAPDALPLGARLH